MLLRLFRSPALMAVLCLVALLPLPDSVLARQDRTIVLEAFDATLEVEQSGDLQVTERIRFRFSGSWNGIIRSLPVKYRTPQGFDYRLRIREVEIVGEDGEPLRMEEERVGIFREFRIWIPGASDAVREVTLRYRVDNALRFFEEHDELYWNVTGDEWVYPIETATARVRLPQGVQGLRANVFTGRFGEAGRDADIEEVETGFVFRSDRELGIREGLTVAVAWNPGVVERPTPVDRILSFLRANFLLIFPFLSFGVMWKTWSARGRDPQLRPIVPAYEPPSGLRPGEVGTLVDNSPDMRDITAGIVDLAVRGYLRIEETERGGIAGFFNRSPEYVLERLPLPAQADTLHTHESRLLNGLFEKGARVELDDLEHEFFSTLPSLKDGIFSRLVDLGFYRKRPDKVQGGWIAAGVLVLAGGLAGAFMVSGALMLSPLTGAMAGVLTALPVFIFGALMPARTETGARALEQVLGFQEFLSRVEEDRFRRMITTPKMFEAYLPYAMALGVEKKWARAFEDIFKEPPEWYVGRPGGMTTFRTTQFVGNLGSMSSRAAAVMVSQPRSSGGSGFSGGGGSSGGGSSGGGFGGGGGRGF